MAKTIIVLINFFVLKAVEGAVPRLRPAPTRRCQFNQYYDKDEGRCLIIPGGGSVVYIDTDNKCEREILRPDLRDNRRYSICRPSKIIHAKCEDDQVFSNRLKRCGLDSSLPPSSHEQLHHYHHNLPACEKSGKFPAPGDDKIFYTCTSNGFRLYREIHSCDENTVYDSHKQMCIYVNSTSVHGFSTSEFPIKLTTIIPKTTGYLDSGMHEHKNASDALEVFSTESIPVKTTPATIDVVSELYTFKDEYSTLKPSFTIVIDESIGIGSKNDNFESITEIPVKYTTEIVTEPIIYTSEVPANNRENYSTRRDIPTTPASKLDIVARIMHTTPTIDIVSELSTFKDEPSTFEPFSTSVRDESIEIGSTDDNFVNITEIPIKYTTETVTEPISYSEVTENNIDNYLTTRDTSTTTPKSKLDIVGSIMHTTPKIPEFSSTLSTSFDVDTFSPSESTIIMDTTTDLPPTTEEEEELTYLRSTIPSN